VTPVVFIEPHMRVSTWRTLWPGKELRRRGHPVQIWARDSSPPREDWPAEPTIVLHITAASWRTADTLISFGAVAADARRWGRLVVSLDDDLTALFYMQKGEIPPEARMLHSELPDICRHAWRIVVTTPRLAEVFGRWGEVHIAPNCIPEWVLEIPPRPTRRRVAWMGTMEVHDHDWLELKPYARDLPPMVLIGAGRDGARMLGSFGAPDVISTDQILDQRRLYRELGRAVAAIVPLAPHRFNQAKSWIKPLEFMARGVRPICSPARDYLALAAETGKAICYGSPGAMVAAAQEAYETWDRDPELPEIVRETGLLMERRGGDAWEDALALAPVRAASVTVP
jgi:hypothetical protein